MESRSIDALADLLQCTPAQALARQQAMAAVVEALRLWMDDDAVSIEQLKDALAALDRATAPTPD